MKTITVVIATLIAFNFQPFPKWGWSQEGDCKAVLNLTIQATWDCTKSKKTLSITWADAAAGEVCSPVDYDIHFIWAGKSATTGKTVGDDVTVPKAHSGLFNLGDDVFIKKVTVKSIITNCDCTGPSGERVDKRQSKPTGEKPFECPESSPFKTEAQELDSEFDHDLSVFPNPSTDFPSIKYVSNGSSSLLLIVYDMMGKVVYKNSESIERGTTFLRPDLSFLNTGIYLLEVKDGSTTSQIKFIIQK